jgi:[acyl-carrier-protein] S-malonyltransferase
VAGVSRRDGANRVGSVGVGSVAFVFPGQGSQYVGMGRLAAEEWPAAAAVFAEADAALGEPLSQLAWSGPEEDLNLTVNAQPAILATSIAILRALEEAAKQAGAMFPAPAFYAGHSMGQYSALVAAGVIDLADGIRLVRERGRQMQASAPDGAMAAVIGLSDEKLPHLQRAGQSAGRFAIANINAPGQVVISGEPGAVKAASESARQLGAKRIVPLPVSVAAHSPLMEKAAIGLREALRSVRFRNPRAPLLANADARRLTTGDACRAELIEHLTRGVDWVAAVEAMTAARVGTFVEVGPGKVLSGLIRRISPSAQVFSTDDPNAPGGVVLPTPTGAVSPA